MLALIAIRLHLSTTMLRRAGVACRKPAQFRLLADLVRLARHPDRVSNPQILNWALCHGHPRVLANLIRSLSRRPADSWRLELMKHADPDLLLPREHVSPVFQAMQRSTGPPEKILVCFTGGSGRLNMPVQLFHCTVVREFDLVVYLRDPARQCFTAGAPGLGENMDELVDGLMAYLPDGCRPAVLGTSRGGIAACRLAAKFKTSRLALFSSPCRFKDTSAIDDVSLISPENAKLFFGEHNERDLPLAEQWKDTGLTSSVAWLKTSSHGTLSHLAKTGRLREMIGWMRRENDFHDIPVAPRVQAASS